METKTLAMTNENVKLLEEILERNVRWFWKIIMWASIILGITLFIPAEILSLFRRRLRNENITGQLFFELGPTNVFLFLIIPTIIIITLIYLYVLHIPKIKKDIINKEKEIGIIRVKEIKELSERDKKDLMGTADHVVKFEKNPFKIDETYFLKKSRPELINAKGYVVEVSKIAKIEFERKIIETIG